MVSSTSDSTQYASSPSKLRYGFLLSIMLNGTHTTHNSCYHSIIVIIHLLQKHRPLSATTRTISQKEPPPKNDTQTRALKGLTLLSRRIEHHHPLTKTRKDRTLTWSNFLPNTQQRTQIKVSTTSPRANQNLNTNTGMQKNPMPDKINLRAIHKIWQRSFPPFYSVWLHHAWTRSMSPLTPPF